MTSLLRYDLTDGVATITLDDGKANVLSVPMLQALHGAFDRAEADEAVVLVTGRAGRFSAGFDLATFQAGPEPLLEMLTLGGTLTERVLAFPRPVVAAVSGHAIAAGAFIPLAADLRLGADGPFQIGLNETRIGLTLPAFVQALARERLAPSWLPRAAICGELLQGSDAVSAGYLDRIVAPDELMDAARAAALELRAVEARAYAETKLMVRADVLADVRAGIDAEFTRERFGLATAA